MRILNLLLDFDTKKNIRDYFFDRAKNIHHIKKFLQFHIHQSRPLFRRVNFISSNRLTLHLHLQQVHLQQILHFHQIRICRLNFNNWLHIIFFHFNQSDQLHLSNNNHCKSVLHIYQPALHISHTREHFTHIHVHFHFHLHLQSLLCHLRAMQRKLKT